MSRITDKILPVAKEWQQRPLEPIYAVMFLDAIHYHACTNNLTGVAAAIEAVFPKTEIQNCIIHRLRNSGKYVSYKDLKLLMTDLKAVYAAVDEQAALVALEVFAQRRDKKYPKISQSWRENWPI